MSSAISATQVGAQVRGRVCVSLEKADSEAYKHSLVLESINITYHMYICHRNWPFIAMITVTGVRWEF